MSTMVKYVSTNTLCAAATMNHKSNMQISESPCLRKGFSTLLMTTTKGRNKIEREYKVNPLCKINTDEERNQGYSVLTRFLVLLWFPGTPPRFPSRAAEMRTGNSKRPGTRAELESFNAAYVCSLVPEMNAKVPFDSPNLILCNWSKHFDTVLENNPAHWGMWFCRLVPFQTHFKTLSTNQIQYVRCKPINQCRLAPGKKALWVLLGPRLVNHCTCIYLL